MRRGRRCQRGARTRDGRVCRRYVRMRRAEQRWPGALRGSGHAWGMSQCAALVFERKTGSAVGGASVWEVVSLRRREGGWVVLRLAVIVKRR